MRELCLYAGYHVRYSNVSAQQSSNYCMAKIVNMIWEPKKTISLQTYCLISCNTTGHTLLPWSVQDSPLCRCLHFLQPHTLAS